MAGRRDQLSSVWRRALTYVGLREDEHAVAGERRGNDLAWAVFGPVLMVAFAWTVFGQGVGMIAVLVMLPFLIVGVRDVLSGRAAERRRRSGHDAPSFEKSR